MLHPEQQSASIAHAATRFARRTVGAHDVADNSKCVAMRLNGSWFDAFLHHQQVLSQLWLLTHCCLIAGLFVTNHRSLLFGDNV